MNKILSRVFEARFWALFLKELRQIKRNRQLIASLIIPPTVQLLIFGFALNPDVTGLRLGIVDESRTTASRELSSAFIESHSFVRQGEYPSSEALGRAIAHGDLDAGLIIPSDYATRRDRETTASVQLILDAVNSNTAGIAAGYAQRIIGAYNERLGAQVALQSNAPQLRARIALLYNPGLRNSWYILTGVLGILLVLNGSLVAASTMVKEKEVGTVEQLLMTPASAWEIIAAKIAPLFLLLSMTIWLALGVGWLVFEVPVRGSLFLLYCAGALCVLAGIGLGTFLATFSKSQQQAQLMSFFVNPPVALISGATTPLEAMPEWMQMITILNPVRHFSTIARGVMLKGAGMDVLYPNVIALAGFALFLVAISAWRFRKQLG